MKRFLLHGSAWTHLTNQFKMKEINKLSFFIKIIIFSLLILCASFEANAAAINFTGNLDIIQVDTGGGVYSGTPVGTDFVGAIDNVTANGNIYNGTTITNFGCCIAAGGLSVTNDQVLDAETAALLNTLTGSSVFNEGDLIDGVNIEGDTTTSGGGRIEVGLSYVFAADTFSNDSIDNYPFNPNDVLVSLFFIYEENDAGGDVYSAVGQLTCGELDTDLDSINDLCDNCPSTPFGVYVDKVGCPLTNYCDVNGDIRVGLEEAIYALQVVAGLKVADFTGSTGSTGGGGNSHPRISIGGTVLDTNGNPLSDITVGCQGDQTITNSSGQWVLHNLIVTNVAGTDGSTAMFVTCVVEAPNGYLGAKITIYPEAQIDGGSSSGINPPTITFIDGMYVEAGTVFLPRLNSNVTGILRNCDTGEPLVGVKLYLDFYSTVSELQTNTNTVVYSMPEIWSTSALDGAFTIANVPDDSILRLYANGFDTLVTQTCMHPEIDCSYLSTANEGDIYLGNVSTCSLPSGDNISPCVSSVAGVEDNQDQNLGIYLIEVDGISTPVEINFTESINSSGVDMNSIVVYDNTLSSYLDFSEAIIIGNSLIISTSEPIPASNNITIYMLRGDFQDLAGNFLGSSSSDQHCPDISYVDLITSNQGAQYITLNLQTYTQ